MKYAFIGTGNMGSGMVANLIKAGHDVNAFDINPDALARAEAAGCNTCGSTREAVEMVDVVYTMLPDGPDVVQVLTEEVFGFAPTAALICEGSTIPATTVKPLIEQARAAGYEMIDTPCSGGIAAAAAGTLTFMVGASDPTFEWAQKVVEPMAGKIVHAGGPGMGQVAKMCNNMLLGIHMAGTCEAFALADKYGLDLQTFYEISSRSTGGNWSMNMYTPVPGVGVTSPADNDYKPGFACRLMLKDIRIATAGAEAIGARVAMGQRAEEVYAAFVAAGNGEKDMGALFPMLKALDG